MSRIRIGIVGYGNIGKGAERAVLAAPDMELRAIFTRRDPVSVNTVSSAPILAIDAAEGMKGEIDVMLLCGGSAKDLPEQGPRFAAMFNIVDSFDTHAKIPEYLAVVDAAAINTTAIISSGWDPGLFSLLRLVYSSILPDGESYTFWGPGVSQGHSNAILRIEGVRNAIQYTIPRDTAIAAARSGARPKLETRDKHVRECFVVTHPGADRAQIEQKIKGMPNYFKDYDTVVNFIGHDEFIENHSAMPHGGFVIHSGRTGENGHVAELSLKLDSNPEFTGSIMTAYARAAFRMSGDGLYGAKTVFDVPPIYLSPDDRLTLIKELL